MLTLFFGERYTGIISPCDIIQLPGGQPEGSV